MNKIAKRFLAKQEEFLMGSIYSNYFQFSKIKRRCFTFMQQLYSTFPFLAPNTRFLHNNIIQINKVLDLGCGEGNTIKIFKQISPRLEIHALDIEKSPHLPEELLASFSLCDLNQDSIPYPADYFDFVNCQHVIEHIENPTQLFKECLRVLKPNGTLYVESPDARWTLLPHLPFICGSKGGFNFWDDPTHIRPYTRPALAKLASMAGFNKKSKTFYVRKWGHTLSLPLALFSRDNDYKIAFLHPFLGLWCGVLVQK